MIIADRLQMSRVVEARWPDSRTAARKPDTRNGPLKAAVIMRTELRGSPSWPGASLRGRIRCSRLHRFRIVQTTCRRGGPYVPCAAPESSTGGAEIWKPEHRRAAVRHRLRYPSDLTDAEWVLVEPMIPPAKRGGRRRAVSMPPGVFGTLGVGAGFALGVALCPPGRRSLDRLWRRRLRLASDRIRHLCTPRHPGNRRSRQRCLLDPDRPRAGEDAS